MVPSASGYQPGGKVWPTTFTPLSLAVKSRLSWSRVPPSCLLTSLGGLRLARAVADPCYAVEGKSWLTKVSIWLSVVGSPVQKTPTTLEPLTPTTPSTGSVPTAYE